MSEPYWLSQVKGNRSCWWCLWPFFIIFMLLIYVFINAIVNPPVCCSHSEMVVEKKSEFIPGGFLGMGAHTRIFYICKTHKKEVCQY